MRGRTLGLSVVAALSVACGMTDEEAANASLTGGSTSVSGGAREGRETDEVAGTGGIGEIAGSGGAGGVAGSVGLGGDAAYLPQCTDLGPFTTSDLYRSVLPSLQPDELAGAPSQPQPGKGEGAASSCTGSYDDFTCTGPAIVREGPTFEVTDGYDLKWTSAKLAPPQLEPGDLVWLSYDDERLSVCPFCGSFNRARLEIRRNGPTGELLWLGRDGHLNERLTDPDLEALFGVAVRHDAVCHAESSGSFACFETVRTSLQLVLLTDPEQAIPFATPSEVTTPNGRFEIFWADSNDTVTYDQSCADGPGDAIDYAVAIRRITD
jgi:hypothetical protein